MAVACWSDLPEDLIDLIITRFDHHGSDVVRCLAVCTSWYSVAHSILNKRRKSIPFLLLPNKPNKDQEHKDQDQCTRTLLNVDTNETTTLHLPELHDRRICCTTNGWLVTIGLSRPYSMHLLNHRTREQILLPSRTTFKCPQFDDDNDGEFDAFEVSGLIKSAILSATPSDPNCVVLVIYGNSGHLGMCRVGDEAWTHVDDTTGVFKLGRKGICNFNLVFHEATGSFYITDNRAHVKKLELELDCASLSPNKAVRIASPVEEHIPLKYLVESVVSRDLWLVLKNFDDDEEGEMWYNTVSFTVLRVDLVTKEMSRIDDLGQEALFLGHNGSISVVVDGDQGWCRPNCIYFVDDYFEAYLDSEFGCYDMGVFDLATMRVEKEGLLAKRIGKKEKLAGRVLVGEEELWSRICSTPFYWIDSN